MARIVFLLGSYFPDFSATSKCGDNIIQEISKQHQVDVICYDNTFKLSVGDGDTYNGISTIRIKNPRVSFEHWITNKLNSNSSIHRMYRILRHIGRLVFLARFLFSTSSLDKLLVKRFYSAIKLCEKNGEIDAIIPISFPFEGISAAKKFKIENPSVLLLPYIFDSFSDNPTLHRFKWLKSLRYHIHKKEEEEVYINADKIFVIKQLLNSSLKDIDDTLKKKIEVTEHPVLIKPNIPRIMRNDSDSLNVTYAGSLYKDIRRPNYFLEIMKLLLRTSDFQINMYSFGNCDDIVQSYKKDFGEQLVIRGKVPFEDSQVAISRADILISIGNTTNFQTPSKIFEYISFGKPIVHFYSVEDDLIIETLANYPLSICIKEDISNIEKNAERLINFFNKNANKGISFEDCEKIYPDATPSYIAKQICDYVRIKQK